MIEKEIVTLIVVVLTVFGSVLSGLLVVIAYFLKKTDAKLDHVSFSVIELNKTMGIYITKHDHLESLIQVDMQNLKEFKEFTYNEINKINKEAIASRE